MKIDKEWFMARVCKDDSGCWLWTGAVCKRPGGWRGQVVQRGQPKKYASRVSYELFNREIPVGLVVRHTCDMTLCVNPEHLVIGTQLDNIADRVARGRHGGPHGENHPKAALTAEKVKAIRQARDSGKSWGQLSREFGESITCVRYAVVKGWRHVL